MNYFVTLSIAAIWLILVFRVLAVQLKCIKYVKRNHPEILSNGSYGSGPFGGSTIFNLCRKLNDNEIFNYESKYKKTIKQLLLGVAVTILIFILLVLANQA